MLLGPNVIQGALVAWSVQNHGTSRVRPALASIRFVGMGSDGRRQQRAGT